MLVRVCVQKAHARLPSTRECMFAWPAAAAVAVVTHACKLCTQAMDGICVVQALLSACTSRLTLASAKPSRLCTHTGVGKRSEGRLTS